MHSKSIALMWAAVCVASIPCFGAADRAKTEDAGVVVTEGATIEGDLEGSLQVIEESGAVHIGARAAITGELAVPPEKTRRRGQENRTNPKEVVPSARISLNNRGGAGALRGGVRAVEKFPIPPVLYPGRPATTHDVVVRSDGQEIDFKALGDLTVDHAKAVVLLPPGSYGDVTVNQGTLLVGFGAGPQALRYDFGRLDVGESGQVLVAGAVVITVEEGGSWRGKVGDENNPFWLDLRVVGGDVTLGAGARFDGFLNAPASRVTIGSTATLKGELVARQLDVEERGRANVLKPEWTAAKGRGNAPSFSQRALRFQRELPNLQQKLQGQSSAAVAYPADFPYVMISPKRSMDAGAAAAAERVGVFEAFCTLFEGTGFERAAVVLTSHPNPAEAAPAAPRNIILTAVQFEELLEAIGGSPTVSENIPAVRASPELLGQFMSRALSAGFVPSRRR